MKTLFDTFNHLTSQNTSRRSMLKMLGLGLAVPAAATVLSACGETSTTTAEHTIAAPETTAAPSGMTWEEMDRMH